jgi:amidohydrolase
MIPVSEYAKAIAGAESELRTLSEFIHANPELGHEEWRAASMQVAILKRMGFKVEVPVAGIQTAFKATWGEGRPRFCFMAEYDALPGIGHACGHNLIAASGIAAAFAAKSVMDAHSIKGSIVLMGTPGEEGKGAKVGMVRQGIFDGIDACLISHPYDRSSIDDGCLSVSRYTTTYHGLAAHASQAPENGINALDAVIQLFNSVNAWRQSLPESSRVHGIITKGGTAANIIPDLAEAFFYIRAADEETHEEMERRFAKMAEAAAFATGARLELSRGESAYKASVYNKPLNDAYKIVGDELGLAVREPAPYSGRISSDFGDVSCIMPGANVHFGIVERWTREVSLHSEEFKRLAGTPYAFSQAMKVAAAMAVIGVRYISEPDFKSSVDSAYKNEIGS